MRPMGTGQQQQQQRGPGNIWFQLFYSIKNYYMEYFAYKI